MEVLNVTIARLNTILYPFMNLRMKTFQLIATAIGLSTILVLNSCEPESTVTPPLVTVNPTTEVSAAPGETLDYQMLVNSDTDLTKAEFSAKFNSTVVATTDTIFAAGVDAAILNIKFMVPESMGDGSVLTLTFTATNTEQTSVTRIVNVTNPPGEINTYTAVIMSDLKNPEGSSFYSIEDNKLMNINGAIAASAEVDLIYYYGATNKATLCAPADKDVEEFENLQNEKIVLKFNTRNNTKLGAVTMTTAEFAAITNDFTIKAKQPAATATAVPTLAVNNVIWAETVTGKQALIRVVDITGVQSTSFITIEVKVQK
jgi:hypothetical protein